MTVALLTKVKQRWKYKQLGVVYPLSCERRSAQYIGQTARTRGARYKGHTDGKHPSSAVCGHMLAIAHLSCSTKPPSYVRRTIHSNVGYTRPYAFTATALPSTATDATRSPSPSLVSCHMTSPVMWRTWHHPSVIKAPRRRSKSLTTAAFSTGTLSHNSFPKMLSYTERFCVCRVTEMTFQQWRHFVKSF